MRDWSLYADDILNACDTIEKYIAGLSYESFIEDSRTRDATIHNLMIIGKAVKKILPRF
ncbi:HepT-like ribonuclease domain-containing protein [uncultured Methanospirillum sp.]|uniref:HepT-like ribonuclease domain-containing protein n=1 Tax=uncultured Methanospirillum sp. TaxID=262503 RepID=UPI0029C85133|nr:HepT-like ribonuclease domain-containing protein [uncultured Methanospirillum sp.]